MVLFGENLKTLRTPGWEGQYIDYGMLKDLIAKITNSASADDKAQHSAVFMDVLVKQITKVNTFVEKQRKLAVAAVDRLPKSADVLASAAQLDTPKETQSLADACAKTGDSAKLNKYLVGLKEVSESLTDIRHFVGTNVIAATKIVKKHDKHVDESLSKRAGLSDCICKQPFYSSMDLPNLVTKVDSLVNAALTKVYTGVDVVPGNEVVEALPSGRAPSDDEHGELRTLPAWLLRGTDSDAGAAPQEVRFTDTYITEWRFKKVDAAADVEGASSSVWTVDFSSDAKTWEEMDGKEKFQYASWNILKISWAIGFLYLFICSLSFLADGFRLVAGKRAAEVFSNSEIFNNPVAGVMVGVLVTVLVQSSSTSTSITITMVAADLLTVKQAIPIIMGANIGTSVTSTIVALGQAQDRDEFRRAFAAATVHDMFNFLTVSVLLPCEAAFNMLAEIATSIVGTEDRESGEKPPDILKVITSPFTKWVIQIDKKIISKLAECTSVTKYPTEAKRAECDKKYTELTFFKKPKEVCTYAADQDPAHNYEVKIVTPTTTEEWNYTTVSSSVKWDSLQGYFTENVVTKEWVNITRDVVTWEEGDCTPEDVEKGGTHYLFEFMHESWSDVAGGTFVLIMALAILCTSLVMIVKVLRSILKGRVAVWLHQVVNEVIPDAQITNPCCPNYYDTHTDEVKPCVARVPLEWVSGYLAMAAGLGLTIVVQSSSITTAALTPLVGVGVIKLERMYPTVLGANIGTTVTGLLAALSADGSKIKLTLSVAVAHLFFNILGIFLWYGIDDVTSIFLGKGGIGMRKVPIEMARKLGNITAVYRWFPLLYLFIMFFIVPLVFMGLSVLGDVYIITFSILCVLVGIFAAIVTWFQHNSPESLPMKLRTWEFLPLVCRSLEPYDKHCFGKCCACVGRAKKQKVQVIKLNSQKDIADANARVEGS